jgi:HSP20 family protein
MRTKRQSFFEKLTGSINLDDGEIQAGSDDSPKEWKDREESTGDAQLTLDMYQTPTEIIIHSMVAGVRPDDLEINITREMVTIKGKREKHSTIQEGDFFCKELYWGSFARTILLPQEVDAEKADAVIKNGLLTIKLPKINKEKSSTVKVKAG